MSTFRNFPGLGLELWDTGGGCTALGKNLSFGGYVLLTAHNYPSQPCEGEAIAVGFYEENGDAIELEGYDAGDGVFMLPGSTTDDEMVAFINKWATALEGK